MQLRRPHYFLLAGLVAAALRLTVFGTIRGQVLDDETKQPIAGVVVVAKWRAVQPAMPEARSTCLHVESATTDAEGKFRLNNWIGFWYPQNWTLIERLVLLQHYHRDYELRRGGEGGFLPETLYLHRFHGTTEQWFHRPVGGFTCWPGVDESAKNLYRIWSTMAADYGAKAETQAQQEYAELLLETAKKSLVNREKPTTEDNHGRVVNVDPKDSYKPEDLLK